MNYTKIPATTFQNIQLNAGILVEAFDPSTGEVAGLVGATTGGVKFGAIPTYTDYGEDIDNCPKNTKEMKKQDSVEVKLGGTFVTITPNTAKGMIGAADIDPNNANHIIPRKDLEDGDFTDLWWVGDYSDVNSGADAGFCAIHLKNVLNTAGFQIQSTDKGKGQFAFEYTAHFSMANQDEVPYDVYVKGGGSTAPFILLDRHSLNLTVNQEVTLGVTKYPANATVTWASSASGKASVTSAGKVKGLEAGDTTITATITVDGHTYNDTCLVVVAAE